MKMKQAVLDHLLLGFIIVVSLLLFGGTVADEFEARKKYYQLKKLTDNATRTVAYSYLTHYLEYLDRNTTVTFSESLSDAMLDNTKLGLEIKNKYGGLTYDWEWHDDIYPSSITAKIENYKQKTFWWAIFEKASFTLNAESTLPIPQRTGGEIMPLAINGCDGEGGKREDLFPGTEDNPNIITFQFTGYDDYYADDQIGTFGITQKCEDPTGNAFFADYKNDFSKTLVNDDGFFESDINIDINNDIICLPGVDFDNPDTVDPKQLYQSFLGFPIPTTMDIIVLDCDSVAGDVNPMEVIRVELNKAPECVGGDWIFSDAYNEKCLPHGDGTLDYETCKDLWLNKTWNQTQNHCNAHPPYKLMELEFKIVKPSLVVE